MTTKDEAIKLLQSLKYAALAAPADRLDYTSGYEVITMPAPEQDALDAAIAALDEQDKLRVERGRFREALERIAYMGSDCPAAMDQAEFYRLQLYNCITLAATALDAALEPGEGDS